MPPPIAVLVFPIGPNHHAAAVGVRGALTAVLHQTVQHRTPRHDASDRQAQDQVAGQQHSQHRLH